jgi:hypothetical protein
VTFDKRIKTTTITEMPSTLSHVVDTRENHSFTKEQLIEALGIEVPEGYSVSFYEDDTMSRLTSGPDGGFSPWKLRMLMTKKDVIS